jgi:hypothetical protein
MKNIFACLSLILFLYLPLFSQTVDSVPIDKLDSEFIIITKRFSDSGAITIGSNTNGSWEQGRLLIELGNGAYVTNLKKPRTDEAEIKNAEGRPLKFKNAAQAVSFFETNGYDLIDYNVTPFGESSIMSTYMLAKKQKTTAED